MKKIHRPILSIIILDYYKAQKVTENVKSLLQQTIASQIEIIIIDNSCDEKNFQILSSLQKIQQVKLLKSSKNIGYSKGNNQAVQHSSGKYIAIVNPDIYWTDTRTLEILIQKLLQNPTIGIIAPRQKEESGNFALNVRKFPNIILQIARRTFLRYIPPFKKWVQEDEMQHMDRNKSQVVDWLQSSCYLLSRDLWDTIEGFDEDYFLFMADTQMCLESWKHERQVYFCAKTEVLADGLRCSEGGIIAFFQKKSLRIHVIDAFTYFFKKLGSNISQYLIT